ncbi:MAG: 3-oxoacyl-[acyl-carrier-protein] synthase III C-terminal domain-containing protein [bacterium]
MNPVISAIGTAVPQYAYTQEQVFSSLKLRGLFKELFIGTRIKIRRFSIPLEKVLRLSVQELYESYQQEAIKLSKEAINNCLARAKIEASAIDCIVLVSCTGYTCPGLSHYVAREVGLRPDVVHNNLLGMGCGAAAPALRRGYDFLRLNRGKALIVCVEICSATYHPDRSLEMAIGDAIFADGAAAALVSSDGDGFAFVDFLSVSATDHIDKLGYRWDDARLKLVLTPNLPEIVSPLLAEVTDKLLKYNKLKKSSISIWAIHGGGVSILDKAKEVLRIDEDDIKYSRLIWSEYGNLSSPTILFTLKELMDKNAIKQGDKTIMLTMGAGIEVDGILLEYEGGG